LGGTKKNKSRTAGTGTTGIITRIIFGKGGTKT
jgi:hypothetical protein